jgi:hypothetical protein
LRKIVIAIARAAHTRNQLNQLVCDPNPLD